MLDNMVLESCQILGFIEKGLLLIIELVYETGVWY